MKENKYDNELFFQKYSQMLRSQKGLEGAGEWSELRKMLPDFNGKSVLDLGCGYGWHCKYAADHQAKSVLGTDTVSYTHLDVYKRQDVGHSVAASGRKRMADDLVVPQIHI